MEQKPDHAPSTPRWLQRLPGAALLLDGERVRGANEAALRLFGAPRAALVHRPLRTLFRPSAPAGAPGAPSHPRRRTATVSGWLLRPDGTMPAVELSRFACGRRTQVVLLHEIGRLGRRHAELLVRHGELRRIASDATEAQERHRRRIAQAVHDELLQALAAVQIGVESVQADIAQAHPDEAAVLGRTAQTTRLAIGSTRLILDDLSPAILAELGLVPALDALAGRTARRSGLAVACHVSPSEDALPAPGPAQALALYRVAEEALDNVVRHARATRASLELAAGPGPRLTLAVEDDGVGIADPALALQPPALGLAALRERLASLGGRLEIERRPEGGTRVAAVLGEPARVPPPAPHEGYSLLRFLYRAPIGLVQARLDGTIEMLNPVAARHLLPLARERALDNLFEVLAGAMPALRARVDAVVAPSGTVCQSEPLAVPDGAGPPLWLSVLKHDAGQLMAVVAQQP